jgi:hypothetical protein
VVCATGHEVNAPWPTMFGITDQGLVWFDVRVLQTFTVVVAGTTTNGPSPAGQCLVLVVLGLKSEPFSIVHTRFGNQRICGQGFASDTAPTQHTHGIG